VCRHGRGPEQVEEKLAAADVFNGAEKKEMEMRLCGCVDRLE
jgi:hypothetical protein